LHDIVFNTEKDEVKIRAISELHSIEMDLFNLWKQLPDLDIGPNLEKDMQQHTLHSTGEIPPVGEEPPIEQYEKDFGSFKTSTYGQNRSWDAEKVSVTPERTVGIPTKPADSEENYKNVRDLK
jgi:hypothetical protein